MQGRTAYPPLLHNPWVPVWGSGALADLYKAELMPAFWVFDDDWIPGETERTNGLLFQSLRDQWARSMMLGKPAVLQSPVQLPDNVLERFQSALALSFSEMIGKELRPPSVKYSPWDLTPQSG
jgi:hypothetical protein